METEQTYPSVAELRTRNLPRASCELCGIGITPKDPNDLVQVKEATDGISKLDEYLHIFTKLPNNACPACGHSLGAKDSVDAMMSFFGARKGGFRWGICHGEGHCAECGYPARAYHRDVGPLEFFQAVLPYHPDELETKEERDARESKASRGEDSLTTPT